MTTKPAPPLLDVLSQLIISQTPKKLKPLSGGLILAYTPGSHNRTEPGVYRLTLSRRGVWPSETEVRVVQRELREALKKQSRAAGTINWEPWLQGRPGKRPDGRIHYHVLFWEEMTQGRLF